MENQINEEVLCVLKYKNNEIIIDYVPIEKYFDEELSSLKKLCEVSSDNILKIIESIRQTPSFKVLEKHYRYCVKLDGTYQGVTANIEEKIKTTIETRAIFYFNKNNIVDYNLDDKISKLQNDIYNKFLLWVSAYNIEKSYRKCYEDKLILTFSHRMNGWSNPEYRLSDNFRVELKTNFGYGSSSYFFIKIKYKSIDITPVSEWVDYEIAQFSEIIRYTKSFSYRIHKGTYNERNVYKKQIENSNWKHAIEFTKNACNSSLRSEAEFIHNYIIDECEKMASGLEKFMVGSEFIFIGEHNGHYQVDKKGHQLTEFRGEKISGALDFILKILEFDKITEIKTFIERIEACNKKIQPILVEELNVIERKLAVLNQEMTVLKPIYLSLVEKNKFYIKGKMTIQRELVASKQIDPKQVDCFKINTVFTEKFPEFKEFELEFETECKKYRTLLEQIQNYDNLFKNISTYNNKIITYFTPVLADI